jgi:hypothetical protein
MSGGEVTGVGGAPDTGIIKLQSQEQKEKKQLLKEVEGEIEKGPKQGKAGSSLYKIVKTAGKPVPFTLGYHTDEIVNDPFKKEPAAELRKTYLLLDRALTALGYKRDPIRESTKDRKIADEKQIDWSWINLRMVKFFKDQGLLARDSSATSVIFGVKGLQALQRALAE